MKIMLIASSGGHLTQLLNFETCWAEHERHWVTFRKPDAIAALRNEKVTWAYFPVTRHLPNAFRNLWLAIRTLRTARPDVLVSTGAGVAFPFFLVARFLRIRTVYLEVFDRIEHPTVTGLLCYPISDRFCLQWEDQSMMYPDGTYVGAAW